MRVILATLALVVAVPAPLSGAHSYPSCAGAGPYWPTATLAVQSGTAWVACKEEARVIRVPLPSGPLRSVPLGGAPIALVTGFGAVWALDSAGVVSRIDPRSAKITARISTGSSAPYNLWVGDGSLWSVDDGSGEVVRVDPARRKVSRASRSGTGRQTSSSGAARHG